MGFIGHAINEQANSVGPAPQVTTDPAILAQQQQFAQALQAQMNGTGPSVVTQTLNQNAQQNAANAQAMAAGARGTNAGLAQRNALNAAGQANQAAAGQAAIGRAQEELNATNAYGNQVNAMQQQNMGAQQANQQAALGTNQLNAGINVSNTKSNNQTAGGIINGIGSAIGGLGLAHGGMVPQPMAAGGFLDLPFQNIEGGGVDVGGLFKKGPKKPAPMGNQAGGPGSPMDEAPQADTTGMGTIDGGAAPMMVAARGGMAPKTPANEPKSFVARHLKGLKPMATGGYSNMEAGGHVPGHAKVEGDSYANDNVKALLSPGEVVIPRHVMNSKDPVAAAAEFVRQTLAKHKGGAK